MYTVTVIKTVLASDKIFHCCSVHKLHITIRNMSWRTSCKKYSKHYKYTENMSIDLGNNETSLIIHSSSPIKQTKSRSKKRKSVSLTLWQHRCRADLSQGQKDAVTEQWRRWHSWGLKWPASEDRSSVQLVTRSTRTRQTGVDSPESIQKFSAIETEDIFLKCTLKWIMNNDVMVCKSTSKTKNRYN